MKSHTGQGGFQDWSFHALSLQSQGAPPSWRISTSIHQDIPLSLSVQSLLGSYYIGTIDDIGHVIAVNLQHPSLP